MKENNDLAKKYKAMLRQVKAWQPPSTEHIEFKNFMISQIEQSIRFDCSNSYYIDNPPQLLTGRKWLEKNIATALKDIDYHTNEYIKEVERANNRNLWLKQLRESLL